jgi:N-methylhydantoinase A
LHACEIAEELGIETVIVPQHAGVLSALGMLMADAVRDYSAGVLGVKDLDKEFAKLEKRADKGRIERSADIRYRGQSYELNVPWPAGRGFASFHKAHQKIYGYSSPEREVEVVTIRVRARIASAFPKARVKKAGTRLSGCGPALIPDYGSTTLVPRGWDYRWDKAGNLLLRRYTGISTS